MFNIIRCWSSQTREPYPGLVLSKHASALAGNLTFNCQVTRVLSGKSHRFCTLQSHSHLTYVIWGRQLGQVREGCYSFSEREKLKLSSIASSGAVIPQFRSKTPCRLLFDLYHGWISISVYEYLEFEFSHTLPHHSSSSSLLCHAFRAQLAKRHLLPRL